MPLEQLGIRVEVFGVVGYSSRPDQEARLLEIIAAVFTGNVLTAAFLAAMSKALRPPNDTSPSWLVLGGLGLPLLFCLAVLITAEGPPPFLAALMPR